MKISVKFVRKVSYAVLAFIGLFFCSFSSASLAFRVSADEMEVLKQSLFVNASANTNVNANDMADVNAATYKATNASLSNSGNVADCGNCKVKRAFKPRLRSCRGIGNINTSRKVVALTFDDGPHKKYTDEILMILKLYEIRGTFFLVGQNVAEYPCIVKALYANGHVVGNHSYSHNYLNTQTADEIAVALTKTNNLIKKTIGVYPALFRPPYGSCSSDSVRIVKKLKLKTIMWSVDYPLERLTAPEDIANEVIGQVKPGAIILLHDGGGNRESVIAALPIIIKALKSEGYEFLTVPELLSVGAYLNENNDKKEKGEEQ